MTNVDEIFNHVVSEGQHPRIYSDTFMILEQLGHALDMEHDRLYSLYKKKVQAGFWPRRFFTHRQRRFIMKHLKRWLALMVAAALALSLLTGCCTGGV